MFPIHFIIGLFTCYKIISQIYATMVPFKVMIPIHFAIGLSNYNKMVSQIYATIDVSYPLYVRVVHLWLDYIENVCNNDTFIAYASYTLYDRVVHLHNIANIHNNNTFLAYVFILFIIGLFTYDKIISQIYAPTIPSCEYFLYTLH